MRKWVFLGSGRFAVKVLDKLLSAKICPSKVYTLPDRPQGRGLRLLPVPVKKLCLERGLKFKEIKDINEAVIYEFSNFDFILSCDIGIILPRQVVEKFLCLNIHPSLLPRWRGPAPIFWALRMGDKIGGLTIFKMNDKIDAGEVVYQKEIEIPVEYNSALLEEALSDLAVESVNVVFTMIKKRELSFSPQKGPCSYARKIKKSDIKIDWKQDCRDIYNLFRASLPYLGPWTVYKNRRVKIFRVEVVEDVIGEPGEVVEVGESLVVSCGRGAIRIFELQPEAKKRISAKEFICGYRIKVGSVFGGDK